MHFSNSTPHVAVIDVVDTKRGVLVAEVGMIAPLKSADIPIETYTSKEPDKKLLHDGVITLVDADVASDIDKGIYSIDLKTSALRALRDADPLELRFSCLALPKAGDPFRIEIPPDLVEEKRKEAVQLFGRDIHIRAMIGPVRQTVDGGIGCPIRAIDDEGLEGRFNSFPRTPGHVLLIGYFK